MTCKTCGHDESFHNRILNSDLCPFDYIDGECIADGYRAVPLNREKWYKLKDYTVDRMRRGYGYGTKANQELTPTNAHHYVTNSAKHLEYPQVCGCLKFVPAEEPCKK